MPKIKIINHDKYYKSSNFFDDYGNEIIDFEKDPFIENQKNEDGFFITEERRKIGLNDFRPLSLLSLKQDKNSLETFPVIKGNSFKLDDDDYLLLGDQYDVEIFNSTSDYFLSESSRRHIISKNIDHKNRITCFQFDHIKKNFNIFDQVLLFSTVKSNDEIDYGTSGKKWNWSVVDTSIPEFIIDYRFSEGNEICFNQNINSFLKTIGPDFTSTNINDYRLFLESPITDNENFYVRWIPKAPAQDVKVYESISSTELIEWTATTLEGLSLASTDRYFNIENKIGRIVLNTNYDTSLGDIFVSYKECIAVAYANDFRKNKYEAREVKLGRINDGNVGSYYFGIEDQIPDSFTIDLEVEDATNEGDIFNSLYYGDQASEIIISVFDGASQRPIVGEEVEVSITNNLGKIVGEDENKKTIGFTDINGKFKAFIEPPKLGKHSGTTDVTKISSTALKLNSGNNFDLNKGPLFTYLIYKDDPYSGRQGTQVTDQDLIWSDTLLNGRNVILYEFDNSENEFRTIQAVDFDSTSISYNSPLIDVDSTDTSTKYGGYFITGPQYINLDISLTKNKRWINRSQYKILCKHRNQASGIVDYSAVSYELGWKLLSNAVNLSNQIGGALFLTLNPLFGNHTIIFETSNRENNSPILDINVEVI